MIARLPTGVKLLMLLSLTLLPLGSIALFASLDTANAAREGREAAARLQAEIGARRISNTIARTAISLRAAMTAVAIERPDPRRCRQTLVALANLERFAIRYAIFEIGGQVICATEGFAPPPMTPARSGLGVVTDLDSRAGAIRFIVSGANRRTFGIAELPRQAIAELSYPLNPTGPFRARLRQGDESLLVHDWDGAAPANPLTFREPVANGQISLEEAHRVQPLRISEALSIALPLLMWVAAALLGWFAVDRMLLRPLGRLRRAVADYGAHGQTFELPQTRTPALEIRDLGRAFERVVGELRQNELDLAEGLAEQTRLTREVHHRVKNNLQIVASLLNLHARAAKTADTSAAYASIQRRVDALAIVQRNLFAEVETRNGIALRPVIAELASGLHQSAPPSIDMAATLDIANVRVAQDIAAPIAFLVTELFELAMLCSKRIELAVRIAPLEDAGRARLEICSPALLRASGRPEFTRYERVIAGLVRQLRSTLDVDADRGCYAIDIPVVANSPEVQPGRA